MNRFLSFHYLKIGKPKEGQGQKFYRVERIANDGKRHDYPPGGIPAEWKELEPLTGNECARECLAEARRDNRQGLPAVENENAEKLAAKFKDHTIYDIFKKCFPDKVI